MWKLPVLQQAKPDLFITPPITLIPLGYPVKNSLNPYPFGPNPSK
jgi:hypothetical protein